MTIVEEVAYVEELLVNLDTKDEFDEFERETLEERLLWLRNRLSEQEASEVPNPAEPPGMEVMKQEPGQQRIPVPPSPGTAKAKVIQLRSAVALSTMCAAAAAAAVVFLLPKPSTEQLASWVPRVERSGDASVQVHMDNAKIDMGPNTTAVVRESGEQRGVTFWEPYRAKFTVSKGPFVVEARASEHAFDVRSITTTFQVAQSEDGAAQVAVREGEVQLIEGQCRVCVLTGGSLERQPGPAQESCGQWSFDEAFACVGKCGVCDKQDGSPLGASSDNFLTPTLSPGDQEVEPDQSRVISLEASAAFLAEADRLRELGHTATAIRLYEILAERGEISVHVRKAYHWLRAMEGVNGPRYNEYTLREQDIARALRGGDAQ